jgi:imidazolonepropionase-like amidohydrolase
MGEALSHDRPVAIVGATLLTLCNETPLHGHTLFVQGEKIAAVFPDAAVHLPDDARIIDARGLYVLPGFVDMHVHVGFAAQWRHVGDDVRAQIFAEAEQEMALYLANGITRIRNMWGAPEHLTLAARIRDHKVAGPCLHTTSPILDGAPAVWSESVSLTTPKQATAFAASVAAQGYEALKVYNHLDLDTYRALVAAGEELGLPVVGHVPFAVGIDGALEAGQKSVEHFRGYDFDAARPPSGSSAEGRYGYWLRMSDDEFERLAEKTLASSTWNCPTLVTIEGARAIAVERDQAFAPAFRSMPPQLRQAMLDAVSASPISEEAALTLYAGRSRQLHLLKRLHDGGGKLLVGTDASVLNILPGHSLHDEMETFVAAGLSTYETLVCCCRNPARFYGDADWGTIEVGNRADVVLLRNNPLDDIRNTRSIAGTMARGRWFGQSALAAMNKLQTMETSHERQ